MTKNDIDNQIKEFLKVLVYEAQFLAFKNKLLKNNSNNDLKNYIDAELVKISKEIINGVFKKNIKEKKKSKIIVKSNKSNIPKSNKKSKQKVIKEPPQDFFNYKNHTYKSLSEEINTPISVFELILKQNKIILSIVPEEKISSSIWIILQEFVQNKYRIIMSSKRKADSDKIKITNRKFRSTTPEQYRGGNFGKLIYIGKTN